MRRDLPVTYGVAGQTAVIASIPSVKRTSAAPTTARRDGWQLSRPPAFRGDRVVALYPPRLESERTWNRRNAGATPRRDDLLQESSAFKRGADIHRQGLRRSTERTSAPLTADKLPDGILAEHEARRSFRPDAVLGREFLVGRGELEPPASRLTTQGPMPCGCEHSAD